MVLEEEFGMRSQAELETRSPDPVFDNLDGGRRCVTSRRWQFGPSRAKHSSARLDFRFGPAEERDDLTRLVEFHFLCAKRSVDTWWRYLGNV